MTKKLRRGKDKVIAGVCSGIAERLDTDATAVRVLWALLTVCTAIVPGVIAYLLCWVFIPKSR
jgi:phage shock protein PspC (stress-responsive transcriptional regulator)